MLSDTVVDATLEAELPGALEWARRHAVRVESLLPEVRALRFVMIQKESEEEYFLQAHFDRYKELPPVWEWCDESWNESNRPNLSPKPVATVCGPSMFLKYSNQGGTRGIICAPFNRLAFGTEGGPHNDWGNPAQWTTPRPPWVYAVTIGDMLQVILRDFHYTRGRMV